MAKVMLKGAGRELGFDIATSLSSFHPQKGISIKSPAYRSRLELLWLAVGGGDAVGARLLASRNTKLWPPSGPTTRNNDQQHSHFC